MADSIIERGKSHEAKYQLDQEQEFKAVARRNRLLGEWLGERFGMTESEITDYAKTVVAADLEEPGDEDVIRKVMKDIGDRNVDISDADIRAKLIDLMEEAGRQIAEQSS